MTRSVWSIIHDNTYGSVLACGLDFTRKIHEHSKFRKWLFRLICGKYAYREYELMVLNLDLGEFYPYFPYELDDCSYHKENMKDIMEDMFRKRAEMIKEYEEKKDD